MIEVRIGTRTEPLDVESFEDRVRNGRIPPDALLRVPAVTGSEFVPANDLELYRALLRDDHVGWRQQWETAGPPVVTAALVGVQLRVWWFAHTPETADLVSAMIRFNPPLLEDGESWRLITSGLVQVAPIHLLGNMMWLSYAGWNLERALGHLTLLRLYVAAVLGGCVLSALWYPAMGSYGASGGVMGLVGAAIVFGFVRTDAIPERQRRFFGPALLPYLVLMMAQGLSATGVDNASHLGGLLVGGGLAALVVPPWQRRADPVATATWLAVPAVLALFTGAGPHLIQLVPGRDVVSGLPPRDRLGEAAPTELTALAWPAPAGWTRGLTPLGETGATSPAGPRAFVVVEQLTDAPATLEADLADLAGRAPASLALAPPSPPTPTRLAGREGWTATTTGAVDGEPVQVTWWWTRRGLWRVAAAWQVDADRDARLAPLRERLIAGVQWTDPTPLVEARAAARDLPSSPDRRRALAEELSRVGEADEAWALWQELLDAPAAVPGAAARTWEALLRALAIQPRPDTEALVRRAVAADLGPRVVVAAAEALRGAGDEAGCLGLLEIAWRRAPGDSALRAGRARQHLSNLLVDGAPITATWDPLTAAPVAAPPELPLDVDAARPVGAAILATRAALRARAAEQAADADPGLAGTLLLLADGAPPERPEAAVEALVSTLRAEAAPWWWSEPLPPPSVLADRVAAADPAAVLAAVPRR
jgi:rhomboid protease GluP